MKDKKTAVVTGASSGIGRAIADMLFLEGYDVIGIGRRFESKAGWEQKVLDITDTDALTAYAGTIRKERDIRLLVNAAGVGYYGPAEDISVERIKELIRTDLEAPAILCSLFLRGMKDKKDGTIINISSVTSTKVNTHGAVYGACKAGLSSLSASLFAEARKHNVRVIDICPDMTDTDLYRNADFTVDKNEPYSFLLAEDIAQQVKEIINKRDGVVLSKVTIVPQINRIRRKGSEERER